MTFWRQHMRAISYSAGSALIVVWTLLRFFNQRMLFDLVGQQVLTHQWLQGSFGGAAIGTTNYITKMLLLYAPVDLSPGSPRLKMILLTLAVNLVTFILLGVLLEKILQEFGLKPDIYFYGALVWLAAIAGSVFWIQFTNSRNLEVAGGIALLYGGLRYLRKPRPGLAVGLILLGSILFFDDSLQLYMVALPLLVYAGAMAYKRQVKWKSAASLLLVVAVGFVGSRLLFLAAQHFLKLDFTRATGSLPSHSAAVAGHSLVSSAKAVIKLFAGAPDAGRWRELLNLVFLGLGLAGFVYAAWRKKLPRRFVLLLVIFASVNELVYVASGQALQPGTQRYLIMTAPIVVLAIGSLGKLFRGRISVNISIGIALLLAINGLALGNALAKNWDTGFPLDAHLASVRRYQAAHDSGTIYASMDTALPITYLGAGNLSPPLLPLSCKSNVLVKDSLFYDKATFRTGQARPSKQVAIILDSAGINNAPYVCSESAIIGQLGSPAGQAKTDDGSVVLFYSPQTIHLSY